MSRPQLSPLVNMSRPHLPPIWTWLGPTSHPWTCLDLNSKDWPSVSSCLEPHFKDTLHLDAVPCRWLLSTPRTEHPHLRIISGWAHHDCACCWRAVVVAEWLWACVFMAQINTVVSGALDRLHYEKDPCVKYDVNRKLWIYLHRNRTEDEFGKNTSLSHLETALTCWSWTWYMRPH